MLGSIDSDKINEGWTWDGYQGDGGVDICVEGEGREGGGVDERAVLGNREVEINN